MGKQRIKNEKAAGEKAADEKVKKQKQLCHGTFTLSGGNGKIIEKVKPY